MYKVFRCLGRQTIVNTDFTQIVDGLQLSPDWRIRKEMWQRNTILGFCAHWHKKIVNLTPIINVDEWLMDYLTWLIPFKSSMGWLDICVQV